MSTKHNHVASVAVATDAGSFLAALRTAARFSCVRRPIPAGSMSRSAAKNRRAELEIRTCPPGELLAR